MKSLIIKMPSLHPQPEGKPSACPHCGGTILQRWDTRVKPIKDLQVQQVVMHRHQCCCCGRLFQRYPQGVDRRDQSQRLVVLSALLWALGLSTRSVALLWSRLGVAFSAMSTWLDVLAVLGELERIVCGRSVRALGVDGFVGRLGGQKVDVVVVVDMGTRVLVALGLVEEDARALLGFLEPLCGQYGVVV